MHGQSTALDEALVAIFHRTMIWPLVGVYAIMATEIRLAIEGLEHVSNGFLATIQQVRGIDKKKNENKKSRYSYHIPCHSAPMSS
jgi:hypothetical protein